MPFPQMCQEIVRKEIEIMKDPRSGFDIIEMSAKFNSYRGMMVMCYESQVKQGLKKLEDLSPEEKTEIWEAGKEYNRTLGKEQLIDLCRVIYLISENIIRE